MRTYLKIYLALFFVITGCFNSYSQEKDEELIKIEVLFDKLFFAKSDSVKLAVNESIINELQDYAEEKKDLIRDLKDIKNLSVIKSDDGYIYILTWAMQLSNKDMQYFGFIKYFNVNRGKYAVEKIIDNNISDDDLKNKKIYSENWYGALYYKIITVKYKRKRHYVLLAWDGNNDLINKKIIETLYLEDDEIPVFGKNIINYNGQLIPRLIFKYGERVSMQLTYDEKNKRIVWDHLSPSKQELKGQYEYYGPDLTFDALFFDKGIWQYSSDIDLSK
ncbi:MAG: hypothetical protein L3J35_03930 [Bacteroidales bacterium]|nr:hypothetical protein [Bacteroidales bacterium]